LIEEDTVIHEDIVPITVFFRIEIGEDDGLEVSIGHLLLSRENITEKNGTKIVLDEDRGQREGKSGHGPSRIEPKARRGEKAGFVEREASWRIRLSWEDP